MESHRFKFDGIINDRKIYIVECLNTTGSFSTKIWDDYKYARNKCLCCNATIIKVKR